MELSFTPEMFFDLLLSYSKATSPDLENYYLSRLIYLASKAPTDREKLKLLDCLSNAVNEKDCV